MLGFRFNTIAYNGSNAGGVNYLALENSTFVQNIGDKQGLTCSTFEGVSALHADTVDNVIMNNVSFIENTADSVTTSNDCYNTIQFTDSNVTATDCYFARLTSCLGA